MRIVVIGATGNIGSSLIEVLGADPAVDSVLGLARRVPEQEFPKVEFASADITRDALRPLVRGADVVVDLAWAIQPMRDERRTWDVNVVGLHRVLDAVRAERVPAFVYASSIGAYGPRDRDEPDLPVDESFPTTGLGSTAYSKEKAYDERLLDSFVASAPWCRVVRLRPGIVVKKTAGHEISGLFLGPLGPLALRLVDRFSLPIPLPRDVRLQVVHSHDVARALQAACHLPVEGAFNLASEPVLYRKDIVQAVGGSVGISVPWAVLRAVVALGFRLRLLSLHPSWVDMVRSVPLLDVNRARSELGWMPSRGATESIVEAVSGIRDQATGPTPPLAA